jgi:protein-disulfide isomerase
MRKIWVAFLVIFAVATLSPAPVWAADLGLGASDAASLLAISKDDRILGDPAAPITIVEYASMTCPHCAHFTDEVLPELKKKWIDTGKVKLVLRDFPLDDEAVHASMIARCAPYDRFYAFIDTFFADQANWVTAPDYKASLTRLAELGGMSKDQVDTCLKDTNLENRVLASRLVAANQLAVNATPTFFVNGTKYTGEPTLEALSAALEAAGTSAPTSVASSTTQTAPATPSAARLPAGPGAAPNAKAETTTAQTSPASTNAGPSAPANAKAETKTAQAAPASASAEPAESSSPPGGSIWTRLRHWFSNFFGS